MTHTDSRSRPARPSRRPVPRAGLRRLVPPLLAAVVVGAVPAAAQEPPAQAGADALRVYLDCSGGWRGGHCDSDLYRQEITFVNWVREPQDAQVHVILTTQRAGGGGTRYTLDFLGREELEGMEDEYAYSSSVTDVQDETIQALVRTLRLGLVRYAAAAGFGADLEVSGVAAEARAARAEAEAAQVGPEDDPWDFWVFNVDSNFSYESEDLTTTKEFGFGVSANRTTEEWKLQVEADGRFERERFELPQDDGTVEVEENNQDRWNVSAFAVKSLGDHLGVGAELTANNSTRLNRELLVGLSTGVEYNYFPYAESNRRILIGRYVVSVESVEYQDTTVFDLLNETVFQHEVNLDYEAREPWGNANIGAGVSQYLDRTDAWSARVRGFVRYRLFRGFSVFVSGEYEKVEDQISLPRQELSDEDILLGRRQLPTESTVEFRIGLGYSFGSIFNNAVNERFSQGGF